jgi:hypothetical protein
MSNKSRESSLEAFFKSLRCRRVSWDAGLKQHRHATSVLQKREGGSARFTGNTITPMTTT